MFIKSERGFTTSRIVLILDLDEVIFNWTIIGVLKCTIFLILKIPLRTVKRIKTRPKVLVNHEFINTGHCGAGCEEKGSFDSLRSKNPHINFKNEEMTRRSL